VLLVYFMIFLIWRSF